VLRIAPIYQNDSRLAEEPSISSYGCPFSVIREIVETHYRQTLDPGRGAMQFPIRDRYILRLRIRGSR
jgi:hypothetical protein